MKTHRVRFERDEPGTYAVTQAQSVPEGVEHVRDALSLLIGEKRACEAELLADVFGLSDPNAA